MPLQIEGRSQAHKLITSVVEEEGHADGYSHSAHHGDEGAFYQIKARNAAHTGGYYDNRGDGGAATHDGGCKVHGQQHQKNLLHTVWIHVTFWMRHIYFNLRHYHMMQDYIQEMV